jgi:hypothetical protein
MDDTVDTAPHSTAFLDSIWARILALIIACLSGYLLFLAYERYEGSSGGMLAGVDKSAYQACFDERMEAFNRLAEQAGYDAERRLAAENAARESAKVVCAEQARPVAK